MRQSRPVIAIVTALIILGVGTVNAGGLFSWGGKKIDGSGNLVTQSRDLPVFTAIENSGSADLFITIGEKQSVEVTFDDNLVDIIETEVDGKTLYIGSEKGVSYSASRGCRIEITINSLEEIELNGSGDIVIENLNSERFFYDLSGSGDLVVRGNAGEVEISVKGSGDVNARDLVARDAFVRIMGSGDVEVHATESFDGSVYGSGDIRYYGNPSHTSSHVAGSGKIKKR